MNNFKSTAILFLFSVGINVYIFYFTIRRVTKHIRMVYIHYRGGKKKQTPQTFLSLIKKKQNINQILLQIPQVLWEDKDSSATTLSLKKKKQKNKTLLLCFSCSNSSGQQL